MWEIWGGENRIATLWLEKGRNHPNVSLLTLEEFEAKKLGLMQLFKGAQVTKEQCKENLVTYENVQKWWKEICFYDGVTLVGNTGPARPKESTKEDDFEARKIELKQQECAREIAAKEFKYIISRMYDEAKHDYSEEAKKLISFDLALVAGKLFYTCEEISVMLCEAIAKEPKSDLSEYLEVMNQEKESLTIKFPLLDWAKAFLATHQYLNPTKSVISPINLGMTNSQNSIIGLAIEDATMTDVVADSTVCVPGQKRDGHHDTQKQAREGFTNHNKQISVAARKFSNRAKDHLAAAIFQQTPDVAVVPLGEVNVNVLTQQEEQPAQQEEQPAQQQQPPPPPPPPPRYNYTSFTVFQYKNRITGDYNQFIDVSSNINKEQKAEIQALAYKFAQAL